MFRIIWVNVNKWVIRPLYYGIGTVKDHTGAVVYNGPVDHLPIEIVADKTAVLTFEPAP